MKATTRKDFEAELNQIGTRADECKSNGGRIPEAAKYGTWLRRNDPIAFEVAYNESTR